MCHLLNLLIYLKETDWFHIFILHLVSEATVWRWLTWVADSCSSHKTSVGLGDCWPGNISWEIRRTVANTNRSTRYWFVVHTVNLEWWLSNQTLVDNRPYAPQVSLGVIVLGHDDFWGLRENRSRAKNHNTELYVTNQADRSFLKLTHRKYRE